MSIPLGRYELLKKLAAGGMGQVFLARKRGVGFEKLVVVKTLLPHLVDDEEFFQMFVDEARLTARLNHPNIAQMFDVEHEGRQRFVVMEYVHGEDVRRIEKRARAEGIKLPLGVALRIVADAAAGLDCAHQARDDHGQPMGIVHRDISPQNILVGFDGSVKVIDFGVARAAGRAQHTATGVLKGKLSYMSPEQAEGGQLDARSDLFALGIVLWELVCDRRLFKGASDVMTQQLVKAAQVPPPSTLQGSLPDGLDDIVLRSLARRREDRYRNCAELRLALEEFVMRTRLQASSAHLHAFMQTLYADRIAAPADAAVRDELQPGSDLGSRMRDDRATPSPPNGTGRASRLAHEAVTARSTDLLEGGGRSGKVGSAMAALAALVALGSAAFVVWPRRQVHPAVEVKPTQMMRVEVTPPASALAITLQSEPTGAEVELAGQRLGVTPLELSIEKASLPAVVRLTHEGYEARSQTLSEGSGPLVSMQLEKKKQKSGPRPLDIKTGR